MPKVCTKNFEDIYRSGILKDIHEGDFPGFQVSF